MSYNTTKQTILLSTAQSSNKATTNGFEITEANSLYQLIQIMNQKAVSVGLFINGHRNSNYLKACGNLYLIDIDNSSPEGEIPYYQIIEEKLKLLNIAFVSVPSKSANKHSYKRHIGIILNNNLPTSRKAFIKVASYILNTVGIDASKIDQRVAYNNVAFLAPASINKDFINIDKESHYHNGGALRLPKYLRKQPDELNTTKIENTNSTQMLHFTNGSKVPIFEAKKLIGVGESRACYCPNKNHSDQHPSATFYHNTNGTIKIFCGVCGNVNISTDFIPKRPSIIHKEYNYSIIIKNAPMDKMSSLVTLIGQYTIKTKTMAVWCYYVSNISDVHQLLRAKMWLIDHNYKVSHSPVQKKGSDLLDTCTLQPIIKNITLPTTYIPKNTKQSEHYYRYRQMSTFIFKHYFFVETAIWATYQNLINPNRSFEETCNQGLAFFDLVLQTINKQKYFKQSAKTYPFRLKGEAKIKATQKRLESKSRTDKAKMTTRQKKLIRLMNDEEYKKPNKRINITAIAKKLNVSRPIIYRDIKALQEN